MEEAHEDYKKALNEQPGTWQMFGLALTDSFCSTVLPALSVASVARVAGAGATGFLGAAGAVAYGAKKYVEQGGE